MEHWFFLYGYIKDLKNNGSFRSSRLEKLIQLSRQELQLKRRKLANDWCKQINQISKIRSFFLRIDRIEIGSIHRPEPRPWDDDKSLRPIGKNSTNNPEKKHEA